MMPGMNCWISSKMHLLDFQQMRLLDFQQTFEWCATKPQSLMYVT